MLSGSDTNEVEHDSHINVTHCDTVLQMAQKNNNFYRTKPTILQFYCAAQQTQARCYLPFLVFLLSLRQKASCLWDSLKLMNLWVSPESFIWKVVILTCKKYIVLRVNSVPKYNDDLEFISFLSLIFQWRYIGVRTLYRRLVVIGHDSA